MFRSGCANLQTELHLRWAQYPKVSKGIVYFLSSDRSSAVSSDVLNIRLTLSAPIFRLHLSSLFVLNKLLFRKVFMFKVERLKVIMNHLIWIYAVCKNILLSPLAV